MEVMEVVEAVEVAAAAVALTVAPRGAFDDTLLALLASPTRTVSGPPNGSARGSFTFSQAY